MIDYFKGYSSLGDDRFLCHPVLSKTKKVTAALEIFSFLAMIYGATEHEHDSGLTAVLQRLQDAVITLNADKCQFSEERVTFLGHVVDRGIHADPEKHGAILEMAVPHDVSAVRRFLRLSNQLAKFVPNLAEETKPLRDLLCKNQSWQWGAEEKRVFNDVKRLKRLQVAPGVLRHFDPRVRTVVSADSSSFGLGAVLLQDFDGNLHPVAYASQSLTSTEQKYAQ